MAEMRLAIPDVPGHVLVFDTDDIESFALPRDVHDDGTGIRRLGAAHLNLTFREPVAPRWETAP